MPVITVRDLDGIGRTGNQLFLYAFARGYAERMGCELQIPQDWWGRRVFENVNEPPIAHPHLAQTENDGRSRLPLGYFFGQKDIDLFVYGQHQIYLDFYTRAKVKEWFKFKPKFEFFVPTPHTYTALHLRRGDYVTHYHNRYAAVMEKSYNKAIKKFSLPQPVYRVTEGWSNPEPMLSSQGLGWLEDFLRLRDAAHLLRANSSFSVWAGWLGNGKVYSPAVNNLTGWQDVEFVDGNHKCTAGIFRNQSDLHLKEA